MQIEQPSEGQTTIQVVWFFTHPGAKRILGENAFTSGIWDRDTPALPPLLGAQPPYPYPYYTGEDTYGYAGQCQVGTADEWANGVSATKLAAPTPPIPVCCLPPKSFFQIDQVQSIRAPQAHPLRVEQVQSFIVTGFVGSIARIDQVQTMDVRTPANISIDQVQAFIQRGFWRVAVDQVQSFVAGLPRPITVDQVQSVIAATGQTLRVDQVQDFIVRGPTSVSIDQVQSISAPSPSPISVDQVQDFVQEHVMTPCYGVGVPWHLHATIVGTGALAYLNGTFSIPFNSLQNWWQFSVSNGTEDMFFTLRCGFLSSGQWCMTVEDDFPTTYSQSQNALTFTTSPFNWTFPTFGPGWPWASGDTLTIVVHSP